MRATKKRLDHAEVGYKEVKDQEVIEGKGFKTVPQLEVETGKTLDFNGAIIWVNQLLQTRNLGVS